MNRNDEPKQESHPQQRQKVFVFHEAGESHLFNMSQCDIKTDIVSESLAPFS
jgi:hypothetical protein